MTLTNVIKKTKEKTANTDVSGYNGLLAVQVTLTDQEKAFYVEIKDGKLAIEPYEYDDRQANIIIASDKFVKLINNKLDPAVAFATGQLKVEGDAGKALELANLFKD